MRQGCGGRARGGGGGGYSQGLSGGSLEHISNTALTPLPQVVHALALSSRTFAGSTLLDCSSSALFWFRCASSHNFPPTLRTSHNIPKNIRVCTTIIQNRALPYERENWIANSYYGSEVGCSPAWQRFLRAKHNTKHTNRNSNGHWR